jgi:hypothetical protein
MAVFGAWMMIELPVCMSGRKDFANPPFRLSLPELRANELKSNNGVTNEIGLRKMRATARAARRSLRLHV